VVQGAAFDLDEPNRDPLAGKPLVDGVRLPGVVTVRMSRILTPRFRAADKAWPRYFEEKA